MELVIYILVILFIIAYLLAFQFLPKAPEPIKTEDFTYVKPKVIPYEYTDTDIQEKKKIFEECLRNGMTQYDALKRVMEYDKTNNFS